MAVFYNQATLSYNGNVTSSNIITGELIEVLSAAKNAVIDTYSPDNDNVFVISITNTGETPYTDLTVTDDLGRYDFGEEGSETQLVPLVYEENSVNYYVNGVQQPTPVVTETEPLTITGITVPAGGNAIIIYAAKADQYAPLGENASITNTATIAGEGLCTPITAAATITPLNTADLAISKSVNPASVPENGQLTYTFIIQNYGSAAALDTDNVVFRDIFNPILAITSVSFNDTVWIEGTNYNYTAADGDFISTEGSITVPAADFIQDPVTGAWSVQPGTSTLIITGNVNNCP